MVNSRDGSGDDFTGGDGYGDITGDEIFTGDITGVKIGTGEAFSAVELLEKQSVYARRVILLELDTLKKLMFSHIFT